MWHVIIQTKSSTWREVWYAEPTVSDLDNLERIYSKAEIATVINIFKTEE